MPLDERGWRLRNARHRHNGHQGSVRMAAMNMQSIMDSPFTTHGSKLQAEKIRRDLELLRETLLERRDPCSSYHSRILNGRCTNCGHEKGLHK